MNDIMEEQEKEQDNLDGGSPSSRVNIVIVFFFFSESWLVMLSALTDVQPLASLQAGFNR